jgi:hypothetical protein
MAQDTRPHGDRSVQVRLAHEGGTGMTFQAQLPRRIGTQQKVKFALVRLK